MQISLQNYAQAWYESLKQSDSKDWAAISERLLEQLQRAGKLSWRKRILQEVQNMIDKETETVAVHITAAHDIEYAPMQELIKQLLDTRNVRLSQSVNKDLLGGFILETANDRWDLTIKNQLDSLSKAIKR